MHAGREVLGPAGILTARRLQDYWATLGHRGY
jgi:hypothetical protein